MAIGRRKPRGIGAIWLTVMLAAVGLIGASHAQAKPIPGMLTIKAKRVPSGLGPAEIEHGLPATAKALYGRLDSEAPACERNRVLYARYLWSIFDQPGDEPSVIKLNVKGGGPLRTRAGGAWKTGPLSFLSFTQPIRIFVSVFVKRQGRCAKVESETITVRAEPIAAAPRTQP